MPSTAQCGGAAVSPPAVLELKTLDIHRHILAQNVRSRDTLERAVLSKSTPAFNNNVGHETNKLEESGTCRTKCGWPPSVAGVWWVSSRTTARDEGLINGAVYNEQTSNHCVTLSPCSRGSQRPTTALQSLLEQFLMSTDQGSFGFSISG